MAKPATATRKPSVRKPASQKSGDMSPEIFSKDQLLQLYIYQSELFWKLVSPVPVIEIALLGGWYVAWSAGDVLICKIVLAGGMFILGIQLILLFRTARFLGQYHDFIRPYLPAPPPVAKLGLTGRKIAQFACGILIAAHACLLFVPPRKLPDANDPTPAVMIRINMAEHFGSSAFNNKTKPTQDGVSSR